MSIYYGDVTPEQEKLLDEWFDKYGDCGSCGWHGCLYEIFDDIKQEYLDAKKSGETDIWHSCHSENNDEGDHRGCYWPVDELDTIINHQSKE